MFLSLAFFFVLIVFFTVSPSHYLPQRTMTNYKAPVFNKAVSTNTGNNPMQTKLVFLVIDGMSYRFVDKLASEIQNAEKVSLSDLETGNGSNIAGRLTVFKKFKQDYPEKVILQPAYHSSPTWTVHGIKSLISGSLPSESLKDMLFAESNNFEVLMDGLKGKRKSYFIGDVYWKYFIDKRRQSWESVEFTNWFGSNTN
jgi:hypothetical protein